MAAISRWSSAFCSSTVTAASFVVALARSFSAFSSIRRSVEALLVPAGLEATTAGATGVDLTHFPMKFEIDRRGQSVTPTVLLVDLHEGVEWSGGSRGGIGSDKRGNSESVKVGEARLQGGVGNGLHLVLPMNGDVFAIEGSTGCTSNFHVGAQMYSMVLAGDVAGTGKLSLVVGTMNGDVVGFETRK